MHPDVSRQPTIKAPGKGSMAGSSARSADTTRSGDTNSSMDIKDEIRDCSSAVRCLRNKIDVSLTKVQILENLIKGSENKQAEVFEQLNDCLAEKSELDSKCKEMRSYNQTDKAEVQKLAGEVLSGAVDLAFTGLGGEQRSGQRQSSGGGGMLQQPTSSSSDLYAIVPSKGKGR